MKLTFTSTAEPWTSYTLSDGTEVRVRIMLLAATRIEGQFNPDGTPVYQLQCQQIMHVDAPDNLKQVANVQQIGNA